MLNETPTDEDFTMIATTLYGLEAVLEDELKKLGAKNIEVHNRSVSFTGDKGFLYKSNLCLRTALRVLKPIRKMRLRGEQDFYEQIKKMKWESYMHELDSIAIDSVLNTHLFNHSQYVSQKAKDAICDRFRELTGKRPSVDLENPAVRIHIHIYKETCTVSLDSSGDSLHKRAYREETNRAPINEVLAAGMVALSGWNKLSMLIDPMCGSGTLAIEAAINAAQIPPGIYRKKYAFMNWVDFDDDLWKLILNAALKKIKETDVKILASDVSDNVIKKAKQNIKSADVEDLVTCKSEDFFTMEKPTDHGILLINPPYGERMDEDDILPFYKKIGDTLKSNWSGWDAWLISSNTEAIKQIGLRPSRKITLYNGSLECKFMKFEMYSGTKRTHKFKNNTEEEIK